MRNHTQSYYHLFFLQKIVIWFSKRDQVGFLLPCKTSPTTTTKAWNWKRRCQGAMLTWVGPVGFLSGRSAESWPAGRSFVWTLDRCPDPRWSLSPRCEGEERRVRMWRSRALGLSCAPLQVCKDSYWACVFLPESPQKHRGRRDRTKWCKLTERMRSITAVKMTALGLI